MKSRVLFLLALWASGMSVSAQNLVPNGGFEDVNICPTTLGNIDTDCAEWYRSIQEPNGNAQDDPSPDWFHGCSSNSNLTPPNLVVGYQQPMEGFGMAGLIPYAVTTPNQREMIGVQLTSSLIIGNSYDVGFNIVCAFNTVNNIAISGLGFKFTTHSTFDSVAQAVNTQAHGAITEVVSDTLAWQTFNFTYQADSAYQYLHLGNFFNDDQIDTLHLHNNQVYISYYFIDDVSVELNPLNTEQVEPLVFSIFPNPVKDEFSLVAQNGQKIDQMSICDLSGKIIQSFDEFNGSKNISILSSGLYFIKVRYERDKYQTIKLIKQ